jgi:hypothetical protein
MTNAAAAAAAAAHTGQLLLIERGLQACHAATALVGAVVMIGAAAAAAAATLASVHLRFIRFQLLLGIVMPLLMVWHYHAGAGEVGHLYHR